MSLSSRIDRLAEMLGGDEPTELPSDREIARNLAHMWLIEAHNETIDPNALDAAARLLAHLKSDEDPEAWIRRNYGSKRDDMRDEQRWAEWRAAQHGLHRGSSLEMFEPDALSKTTIVRNSAPVGHDGYYTPQAEAAMRDARELHAMQLSRPDQRVLHGPRPRRGR